MNEKLPIYPRVVRALFVLVLSKSTYLCHMQLRRSSITTVYLLNIICLLDTIMQRPNIAQHQAKLI